MLNESIFTILNSEFNRDIDDTIINRLSESLFCENDFHSEFWKTIKLHDNFISKINCEKELQSLKRIHLIQVYVGLFHNDNSYFKIIEDIIEKCLNMKEAKYYYIALWCISKLINTCYFKFNILNRILDIYLSNNNIIFDSLFEKVLIAVYFQYFTEPSYEDFRTKFINNIFNKIEEKVFTLIKILERNLYENFPDLYEIELRLTKISLSTFVLKSELLYCYSLCINSTSIHGYDLVRLIDSLDEYRIMLICKKIMYLSNGKIIQIISNKNVVATYLWRKCIDNLSSSDEKFIKSFLSIKQIQIDLIPNEIFVKIVKEGKYDIPKDLVLGKFEIYFICSFLEKINFQNIFETKMQTIIRCLFNNFHYYQEEFSSVLLNDNAKNIYNNVMLLYRSEIHMNKNFDIMDFYFNLISDCLKSESIDNNFRKSKRLSCEVDSLIIFQNYLLQNYENSDCLDILSNSPIRLSKEIMLICLENNEFCQFSGSINAIIDLANFIVYSEDFFDNILCENLFFVLLVFCLTENNNKLIRTSIDFIKKIANKAVTMNIKDLLTVLQFYFIEDIEIADKHWKDLYSCIIDNLSLFQFHKCNINIQSILDTSENKVKDVLSKLTFVKDYCVECRENIEELIGDIALSCKPMDCFGE